MQVTQLLRQLQTNDKGAMHDLVPVIYEELKKLARARLRREGKGVMLQTTALVHETFLKLSGGRHPCYENRSHFYGIASKLMRQVLIDSARARAAHKRGAGQEVQLTEIPDCGPRHSQSLLAMNDALQRLEKADTLKGKLIEMRYFGGMTAEECSVALLKPVHVVRRELRLAQAWLRKEMMQDTTRAHV